MRIHGREAARVKGTLQIELADGGVAELEIDIDVSHPKNEWGIEHHRDVVPGRSWLLQYEPFPYATTYSIKLMASGQSDHPQFVLKLPAPPT